MLRINNIMKKTNDVDCKRPGNIVVLFFFLRKIHLKRGLWEWRVECEFIDSPNLLADYLDKTLSSCIILGLAAG